MKKLFLLILTLFLGIGVTFISTPKAHAIEISTYNSPFMFAYNDEIYIIYDIELDSATLLVGLNLDSYDTQFYNDWDGATLTTDDYQEIVSTAKTNFFINSYGSSAGSYYATKFRLFQLLKFGGGILISSVSSTAIIKLSAYPQYPVIYDATIPGWFSMTLKQWLDLQETSYDIGFYDGYIDGEDDGYDIGHSEGLLSGYDSGYAIGYANGAAASTNEAYSAGFTAGINQEANHFYDDIGKWLVPALIVVLFGSAVITFINIKRRNEE